MISAGHAALARAENGDSRGLDDVPPWQFAIWFNELSFHCPDKLGAPRWEKQRNALRIEVVHSPGARCSRRSPDGRGHAWAASGGSTLVYAPCLACECPRIHTHLDHQPMKEQP